nr:DNA repair protein UVH3 isoform X2 [Tanacetum cinerariifolium]
MLGFLREGEGVAARVLENLGADQQHSHACHSIGMLLLNGSMMLGLVTSCIGTKFTSQFGDLIAKCGKNWRIPAMFPSDVVISAYASPQVDKSIEPFSWGSLIFLFSANCAMKSLDGVPRKLMNCYNMF